MRIVSLIPSATEIVCALGAREELVARSHECDFPVGVEVLPVVTSSKIALDGTGYQINQRISAIVSEGVSVYRVDAAALDALRPDVIITQAQCEVCAVSLRDVEAAVCQMVTSRPRIVALEPNSLDDVWRDIGRVADALGVGERGRSVVDELRARMAAVAATRFSTRPTRPSLACIEWVEPLMAAGNWMPTLVEWAGGRNLFGDAGAHSPWLALDALAAADPDVLLFLPCGFDIARTCIELAELRRRPTWPAWANLRAVREGRVFVADGNQYFNRPGPRLCESLEILAELLHDAPVFGHEGRGWVKVDFEKI